MRILVVDDEEDVRDLFTQRFRKEVKRGELMIDFAHSGEDALNLLGQEERPDYVLILSDINMPGMSGLDLLRQIKSMDSAQDVLMVTAYGDENNYRKAVEFGANGFLTKPVDFKEIRKQIFKS